MGQIIVNLDVELAKLHPGRHRRPDPGVKLFLYLGHASAACPAFENFHYLCILNF